jgi:hypothetical protein
LRKQASLAEAIFVVINGFHDAGKLFFEVWVTLWKTSELNKCLGSSTAGSVLSEPSTEFSLATERIYYGV